MSEKEFKIKELERLFSEGKITLDQYLDTRTKIENSQRSFQEPEQFSPTPQNLAPQPKPPRTFQAKQPRKSYRKIALGIILCLIIFIDGFFAWGYLNPVRAEALTVESHSLKITKFALLFKLKNTGNIDIRISEVRMNGYVNQSFQGWRQGWNGTTFLQPQQTGSVYVYLVCYFYILNASMPHLSSTPSQTELDNFYSWMESYNCTFTFVTDTQHQYNVDVSEFAYVGTLAWLGSLTFTFMKTEELRITKMAFTDSGATITLTAQNTGTSRVTVTEVRVNDTSKSTTSGSKLVYEAGESGTIIIMMSTTPWVSGNMYEVTLISSTGSTVAAYESTAP